MVNKNVVTITYHGYIRENKKNHEEDNAGVNAPASLNVREILKGVRRVDKVERVLKPACNNFYWVKCNNEVNPRLIKKLKELSVVFAKQGLLEDFVWIYSKIFCSNLNGFQILAVWFFQMAQTTRVKCHAIGVKTDFFGKISKIIQSCGFQYRCLKNRVLDQD